MMLSQYSLFQIQYLFHLAGFNPSLLNKKQRGGWQEEIKIPVHAFYDKCRCFFSQKGKRTLPPAEKVGFQDVLILYKIEKY